MERGKMVVIGCEIAGSFVANSLAYLTEVIAVDTEKSRKSFLVNRNVTFLEMDASDLAGLRELVEYADVFVNTLPGNKCHG